MPVSSRSCSIDRSFIQVGVPSLSVFEGRLLSWVANSHAPHLPVCCSGLAPRFTSCSVTDPRQSPPTTHPPAFLRKGKQKIASREKTDAMSEEEKKQLPATTSAAGPQSTSKSMQKRVEDMSEEHRNEIRDAFVSVSKDGQSIESHELKFAMRALGFEPKKEEIRKIMSSMDKDNSGKLSFDQFLIVMGRKFEEKGTREEIMKAFSLFDADNTGRITFENLKQVANELGEPIDDQELREMISEADRDGDGGVDREEFFRIMRKTCLY